MAPPLTLVGRLTAAPQLRFTGNGTPVCSFTLAWNERIFDRDSNTWRDGDANFMKVDVWGSSRAAGKSQAENVANCLNVGDEVIVVGELKFDKWEKDGVKHTMPLLRAEHVGPSLRWTTAEVDRSRRTARASAAPAAPAAPAAGGFPAAAGGFPAAAGGGFADDFPAVPGLAEAF